MGSTTAGRISTSRRLGALGASVAVMLMLGILLLGWFAGSRSTAAVTADPATVPGSTWAESPGLVFADASDIDSLRGRGWTVPLADAPGYEIQSLREIEVAGQPAVRLQLLDQQGHRIEIVEQRGDIDPEHPLDGISGLPSSTAGLAPSSIGSSPVRLRAGSPWKAQIVHDDVVFTLTADTPSARMVRILQHVEAAERAVLEPVPSTSPGPAETVLIGWKRILGVGP